jgi:hypothetical protein
MDSPTEFRFHRGLRIPWHHPRSSGGDDLDMARVGPTSLDDGLGVSPCHWAHRHPAPHGEPSV